MASFATAAMLAACSSPAGQAVPPSLMDLVADLDNTPAVIRYAVDLVARDCMVRHGFSVAAPNRPLSNGTDTYLGLVGVFRSIEQAKTAGYHSTTAPANADQDRYYESLAPERQREFDRIYFGSAGSPRVSITTSSGLTLQENSTGCLAEGRAAVYGSVQTAVEADALRNDALAALGDRRTSLGWDERVAYEGCMHALGYSVTGFNGFEVAEATFGKYRTDAEMPSEGEQAMATADFHCQNEVHLMENMRDHYSQTAGSWVLSSSLRLTTWKTQVDTSLARADLIANR